MKAMNKYFSYRVVYTGDQRLNAKASYPFIGVGVPHGVMPISNLLAIPVVNLQLGIPFIGAPASVVFNTPFLRYFTLLGACDCSRDIIIENLDMGYSVGIIADGIAGIFQCGEIDEVINLKTRKGIAKLALRTGYPILPVYSFGNTELYNAYFDKYGIMEKLSRKVQASLFVYLGRFNLPIPFRRNITMAIGDIIPVEKIENPTQEEIDDLHEVILQSIKGVFDTHKSSIGWSNKKMKFI
eukprot:TRINITY_DN5606_c0_g1_i1.p1 TRINITY_DN5606_c0_g1~~TRINITY_DN5606_c0_g1_i1.p1  ORF type:complete len:240 (-),score=40.64 TRINITY_DN5606_c0_g1_i1:15-734(-)